MGDKYTELDRGIFLTLENLLSISTPPDEVMSALICSLDITKYHFEQRKAENDYMMDELEKYFD